MCTSVIISGNNTVDGRPLMLKHRDQRNAEDNRIDFFKGNKFDFVGLVNSKYNQGDKAWCGTNEAHFSIICTASYNLSNRNIRGVHSPTVMYEALSICEKLSDFEQLLQKQNKPMISTNYGVIDGYGGAAYYEVSGNSFVKFDVNDENIAPEGFLVRTNFSFSGDSNKQLGLARYITSHNLISHRLAQGEIDAKWLFDNISRSYKNEVLGIDLLDGSRSYIPNVLSDQDFVPTSISVSSILFHGVNTHLQKTVMWSILGYPSVGVAIPLTVKCPLPSFMTRTMESETARICDLNLSLKKLVFTKDDKNLFFHPTVLKRIKQRIESLEGQFFADFSEDDNFDISDFYKVSFERIEALYKSLLSEDYLSIDKSAYIINDFDVSLFYERNKRKGLREKLNVFISKING